MVKERDYYFDNAKFLLIFLVVLGHYCGTYLRSKLLLGFYDSIYSFHMPAFILLSGFLSRDIKQQRFKDLDTILLPYIIIQIIYIIYRKILNVHQDWSIAVPIDANWYLLGMFFWRLVIPYFNYIKYPVIISIIISLIIGFFKDIGGYFDLERIITFFPYFVIGYFLPVNIKEQILQFNTKRVWIYVLFGLGTLFFISIAYYFTGIGSFLRRCFIPSYGYDLLFKEYSDYGVFIRVFTFFVSLTIALLFFVIVPNRKTWYSERGSRTLNVFLFHLIILYLFGKYVHYIPVITELLAFPVAILSTLLLSSKFMAGFFNKILNFHHVIFSGVDNFIAYLKRHIHIKSNIEQLLHS